MVKKYAVILTGCGAMDGSEIHEATLALYAIASNGGQYGIFALDAPQYDVIDFINKRPLPESRNILTESARIARGDAHDLNSLNPEQFDALVVPGGSGMAKNMFTYAQDGFAMKVNPLLEKAVKQFYAAKKPIGAMCISPLMIAKVLGSHGVRVTVGPDEQLSREVEKHFGAKVTVIGPDEILCDENNKVITTPAYMYGDNNIANVGRGADAMVKAMIKMM